MIDITGQSIYNTNIANINPFRYRGYYYDVETGFYYLNSRYYDPSLGRFINADDISYANAGMLNGLNLYAYCGNNPVMNTDIYGNFLDSISSIIDFISALFETGINLGIAAVGWATKTGIRLNNIGIGIFLKNQTNQLNSLSNAVNIISKVSTSIAIISTLISVGENIYNDINMGYETGRIISNAITNTVIYGGVTLASGFIGSKIGAIIGSFIPIPGLGTAIGAGVGFLVGLAFGWLLNLQIDGKSIIVHVRDALYSFWRWLFG